MSLIAMCLSLDALRDSAPSPIYVIAVRAALMCSNATLCLQQMICEGRQAHILSRRKRRFGMAENEMARIAVLEERVEALSSTIKTVLTTLMLRGILTKETVAEIVKETKAAIGPGHAAAAAELDHIKQDLPHYLRKAVGESEDDDHGH